jgi:hypothetical protein
MTGFLIKTAGENPAWPGKLLKSGAPEALIWVTIAIC